ncbi:MAG: HNH endonuclease [Bacteroidales bacterium]|nr:HNH endonuclease [Bacteroidales bacterium]
MGISLKTHKLLWGRSGNKCAFEECRNDLIADETETDDESIIGEEAHIVAKKEDGPRGKSMIPIEERDRYDNLILLCRKHHKIIDDQPIHYTVERLKKFKKEHEAWIQKSLKTVSEKDKDDLKYATYLDKIIEFLDFENWNAWTSWILGADQSISYAKLKELESLPNYVVSRFWPGRYGQLENAIFNLKAVYNDWKRVFYTHIREGDLELESGEDPEEKSVRTEAFYKLVYHEDKNVYRKLLKQYEYHLALVEDLTLELTRASNLLIERIRKEISPMYREEEGKLLVTVGPNMELNFQSYKVEYNEEEKQLKFPYPGLKKFMKIREKRDLCFGYGEDIKYFPLELE